MQLCSSWDYLIQSKSINRNFKGMYTKSFCLLCRTSCYQTASIPFMICAKNFTHATLVQPPWRTRLSRPWQNVSFCCSFCNWSSYDFLGFTPVIVMGFILLSYDVNFKNLLGKIIQVSVRGGEGGVSVCNIFLFWL